MGSPEVAWMRLACMRDVVRREPAVAHAVRCLSLRDQLELTLELLRQDDWCDDEQTETLSPNVIPFRSHNPR